MQVLFANCSSNHICLHRHIIQIESQLQKDHYELVKFRQDAAWSSTLTHVKKWPMIVMIAMIAASCTPPAPLLILSCSVVVVVGVACCCCILFRIVLMLVLTFAPCTLTFAPCACGGCHGQQHTVMVFLTQLLAQSLHLHPWWFHPLQLTPVVYFLPPTSADTGLTLGQLNFTKYSAYHDV